MGENKLSFEGQIEKLKSKGIRFDLIKDYQAKKFLCKNNYYFRINEFRKVFNKKPVFTGQTYVQMYDIDFGHLKVLSTLDMYLRKILLCMCIDIEHFLKVSLINDATKNEDCDGQEIISVFFQTYPYVLEKMAGKCCKNSHVSSTRLLRKYCDKWTIWSIVEVLSFSDFSNLYKMYYAIYSEKYQKKINEKYTYLLFSVRMIRNSTAHNNCLLSKMSEASFVCQAECGENGICRYTDKKVKPNTTFHPTGQLLKAITDICYQSNIDIDSLMDRPIVHDITAVIYMYSKICPTKMKYYQGLELHSFLEIKCKEKKEKLETKELEEVFNYFSFLIDKLYPLA